MKEASNLYRCRFLEALNFMIADEEEHAVGRDDGFLLPIVDDLGFG